MAKLVAFYSRADENYFSGSYRYVEVGNTEKVANMIVEATGADFYKIEQVTPYSADYNTCIDQAKADLRAKARPEIVSVPDNIDEYDEVYLGFPNYWGKFPMAVFTFLEKVNWEGKTIHPFITHEGSGFGGIESDIRNTCTGATVTKGLAIHGGSVDGSKAAVEKWAK
ncbi:flavodoxin [Lachnospiraceae bacterium KM106-2]|nr:flavodoxin [Lachnospiraceae bacterium KM106-2]